MELPSQRVHLVQQVDHGLHRLVVEAHLVDELGQQARARHVDRLEDPGLALGARPQQAALHPALDMDRGQAAMQVEELLQRGHVNCSIALRGSWARPASHFSKNSFSAGSGLSGSTTLSLTY